MRPLRDVHTFYDSATRIWSGPPTRPVFNPDQSIGELVLAVLERNRNKVVQISADSGVQLTGDELRLRTIRLAQNLSKLGYSGDNDGTIFAMAVRNGENAAPLLFACFALGIPVNTLEPTFKREDLGHMLSTVKPRVVFCDSDTLNEMLPGCEMAGIAPRIFVMDDRVDGFGNVEDLLVETGDEDSFILSRVPDPVNKVAVLICSSGTTGRSKAVCLSHATCIARVANFFECLPDDVLFATSSLYWLSGLFLLFTGTLWGATRVITREPFSSRMIVDLIQRFQVSVFSFPPSQALAIVNDQMESTVSDLSSLRLPFCGGSRPSALLKRSFEKLIPGRYMEVAYGLSELAYPATFTKGDHYRDGCVGYVRPGVEIMIVDENNQSLDTGDEGEILIRAKYVFSGYYGNEVASREMLDSEGWLHTGDIGRFDEDGFLYVVDRKKDFILYENYRIAPSEIEDIILAISGVAGVCVVGIPDGVYELVTALVVLKQPTSKAPEANEIIAEVGKKLSSYKHLRGGVYFVHELPVTASGKLLRRIAKQMALQK